MKNKILLVTYIILAAALAYWAYPIIKGRYFSHSEKTEKTGQESQPDSDSYEIDLDKIKEDQNMEGEDLKDEEKDNENKADEFLEITNEDCENECAEFKEEKDIRYCRQICGLAPLKETNKDNCDNLTGLEKDYCLKDLAVAKKDFNICQEIKDINIKKTCQNRITEEVLNGNPEPI